MSSTRTDEMSIQAVSPLFGTGAAASASAGALKSSVAPAPLRAVARAERRFIVRAPRALGQGESKGIAVRLTGADTDGEFERRDEDLAVSDLTGPGGACDGIHHLGD